MKSTIAAALCAALCSCGLRADRAASAPSPLAVSDVVARPPATLATFAAQARSDDSEKTAAPPAAELERKIVRNAEIVLIVAELDQARAAIDALLQGAGGYIAGADIDHADRQAPRATLSLRVPSPRLDEVVRGFGGLGTIAREQVTGEEITEQYYDLRARLANSRHMESRLLELLQTRTNKVAELLEVERELSREREQIERFEGKLRLWDHQVALSAVTLHLVTREPELAAAPGFGWQVAHTLRTSAAALGELARELVLALLALVPWSPVLVAAGFALRRGARLLRRKRAPVAVTPQ
jgi:hypothetical protein